MGIGSCASCHARAQPGGSHASVACTACHGGDPGGRGEDTAHAALIRRPGQLDQAARGCSCHAATVQRVLGSPMATAGGMVAVNRYAFGERDSPDDPAATVGALGRAGAAAGAEADRHFRQLCDGCHLSSEQPVLGGRSGCAACHAGPAPAGSEHPALTLQIGVERCAGCHSGTRRVGLSYQGLQETDLPASGATPGHRVLADGRVLAPQPPDVHFQRGLSCIDCHTAREVMGDGRRHLHAEAAVEISCADCHQRAPVRGLRHGELDDESQRLLALRGVADREARVYVAAQRSGLGLINVTVDAGGRIVVWTKEGGRALHPPAPAAACAQEAHQRLTCQACHSAWVPQCIGCHTQRVGSGYREYAGALGADPPVLGVRADGRIDTFLPGMVLTLGVRPAPDDADARALAAAGVQRRLYARVAPHTTARLGRSCASCHRSGLALGYGRGVLRLSGRDPARWRFEPAYEPLSDGLPADAWIGFLEDVGGGAASPKAGIRATRVGLRPFSRAEQERILRAALDRVHPADRASPAPAPVR